jgi:hypothetical protein
MDMLAAFEDIRLQLVARVLGQGDGDITPIEFNLDALARGFATPQPDLDVLNDGSGTRLSFTGPMSIDSSTTGTITLQFGPQAGWNGNWTNPAYNFSAGGGVEGVNFVSHPDEFSRNVIEGTVQGALLGPLGEQSVMHLIDVNLEDIGLIRDVGLLSESLASPERP